MALNFVKNIYNIYLPRDDLTAVRLTCTMVMLFDLVGTCFLFLLNGIGLSPPASWVRLSGCVDNESLDNALLSKEGNEASTAGDVAVTIGGCKLVTSLSGCGSAGNLSFLLALVFELLELDELVGSTLSSKSRSSPLGRLDGGESCSLESASVEDTCWFIHSTTHTSK
jgi:hypothetical protein